MTRRSVSSFARVWLSASALVLLAACGDSTAPRGPLPPNGVVVLNGYGQKGITLTDTTGAALVHIPFGDSFDGGTFVVERDSALSTSSAFGGDLLWIADLHATSPVTAQMPAKSDPSSAAFLHGVGGYAFGVTLRGAGALALVSRTATGFATQLIPSVGRCPTDVFEHDGSFWVVDANADCANFAADGVAQLTRFTPDGVKHETIGLASGSISTSAAAVVKGDVAYVATDGDYDFATSTFVRPAVVSKVSLTTKQLVGSLTLPAGTYGAALHLGGDGRLYLSAYASADFSEKQLFAVDPATMTFTGPRATGSSALALKKSSGAAPVCAAATADALGRVYCVENATGAAGAGLATLYVFDAAGAQLRAFAVGQYGFDLALR